MDFLVLQRGVEGGACHVQCYHWAINTGGIGSVESCQPYLDELSASLPLTAL